MSAKYQPFYDLPASQYEALKADIEEHGVLVPIVVDEDGTTIDGHQRRRACAELHVDCPRTVMEGLSEDEKQGLAVALNAFRRHLSGMERSNAIQRLKVLGWSNRRVAEALGVSHQTIGRELNAGGPSGPPAPPSNMDPETGEKLDELAPEPPRVTGRDGKSYPTRPRPVPQPEPEPDLAAVGQQLADNVPELTNGPAYREVAKALRQLWSVLKDIEPEVAWDGAQRHPHSDLTMEKVDEVVGWLEAYRRGRPHLKVVES